MALKGIQTLTLIRSLCWGDNLTQVCQRLMGVGVHQYEIGQRSWPIFYLCGSTIRCIIFFHWCSHFHAVTGWSTNIDEYWMDITPHFFRIYVKLHFWHWRYSDFYRTQFTGRLNYSCRCFKFRFSGATINFLCLIFKNHLTRSTNLGAFWYFRQ